MKKQLVTVLFALFSLGLFAQSEDDKEYLNTLKISPIEFGYAEFQVAYERFFNNKSSSISLIPSVILKDNHEESKSGVQLMGQYRVYFSRIQKEDGLAFLGFQSLSFYGGLYALYLNYDEDYKFSNYDPVSNEYITKEYHKDIKAVEGGALFGIEIDITQRIVMDLFVGGGVRNVDLEDERMSTIEDPVYYSYGVFDPEYKGVKPKLGLMIGIAF